MCVCTGFLCVCMPDKGEGKGKGKVGREKKKGKQKSQRGENMDYSKTTNSIEISM